MTSFKKFLIIIANAVGLLASIYSLFFTEKLNNFILPGNLICDINKTISCSSIYLSSYSSIFNLPVSLFAMLFFWFVLFSMIMYRNKENHNQMFQLISIINTVALIGCLYLLYVLFFILKSVCISCLLIDSIVLFNFIILFSYFRRTLKTPKNIFPQLFIKNWAFILSFLILFGSGLVLYKTYQIIINSKNKEFAEAFFMQEQREDIACSNSIFFGNKNAKVKIRIFNDIYCGYCKIASEKYRQIFSKDSTVNIEFIFYPLNHRKDKKQERPQINTFLYRVMFSASLDKEFWNFHDIIINQAKNIDSLKVFEIAEKSLDDFEKFKFNFTSRNNNYSLEENISLSEKYKVQGTPTIFINGREFQQWTNINLLKMIVQHSLNIKPKGTGSCAK